MACNNCYPQPCNCGCPDPLVPSNNNGCIQSITSSCVTYDGNNVDCAGIAEGQTLNQVVEELGTTVCQLFDDVASFNNFTCSDLSGCSIDALGDVNTTSATSGDVLVYNGTTWVTQQEYHFTCEELSGCSIDALADVDTTVVVSGDVLTYNGTEFIPVQPYVFSCTDLSGCALDSLGNVIETLPTSGEILVYNGTEWVNQSSTAITQSLQDEINFLNYQISALQASIDYIFNNCCEPPSPVEASGCITQLCYYQYGSLNSKFSITDFTYSIPSADGILGLLSIDITVNGESQYYTDATKDYTLLPSSATSGTLSIGRTYLIADYNPGDDFINVGATVNSTGHVFVATGTTPTAWGSGSRLRYDVNPSPYTNGNMIMMQNIKDELLLPLATGTMTFNVGFVDSSGDYRIISFTANLTQWIDTPNNLCFENKVTTVTAIEP